MADCVSLPNAAELVVELRALSGCIIYGDKCDECGKEEGNERKFCRYQQEEMCLAADAIEQLMQENAKLQEKCDKCGESAHSVIKELIEQNAKLKTEQDAAVADLKKIAGCEFCTLENANPYLCKDKDA